MSNAYLFKFSTCVPFILKMTALLWPQTGAPLLDTTGPVSKYREKLSSEQISIVQCNPNICVWIRHRIVEGYCCSGLQFDIVIFYLTDLWSYRICVNWRWRPQQHFEFIPSPTCGGTTKSKCSLCALFCGYTSRWGDLFNFN